VRLGESLAKNVQCTNVHKRVKLAIAAFDNQEVIA